MKAGLAPNASHTAAPDSGDLHLQPKKRIHRALLCETDNYFLVLW